MQIDLTATLIDMYRETFEGAVQPDWFWIVSGDPARSVLGTLAAVSWEQAVQSPGPGRKTIAEHAAHLRFTLEITLQRLQGTDPEVDWARSFETEIHGPDDWARLQTQLHSQYAALLDFFTAQRQRPLADWNPLHVAVLTAMTGHNAYHLGALRQLVLETRPS